MGAKYVYMSYMHTNPTKLRQQRQDILEQMSRIPRLKRGTLSERKRRSASTGHPGASQFIFQRWEDGRNKAQHVPTADLPKLRSAVEGFQLFNQLAEQFVSLSEKLTELEAPMLRSKKYSPKQPGKRASAKRKTSSS